MKPINKFFIFILLISSLASCSKDKDDLNGSGDEFYSFYPIVCPQNPSFCAVDSSLFTTLTDQAKLSAIVQNISGQEELLLTIGNLEVTVDFEGVADYSSATTNLNVNSCVHDGIFLNCSSIDNSNSWTGGYMEILSYGNGYIEGNLRYIVSKRDALNNSTDYSGADGGLFKIKMAN